MAAASRLIVTANKTSSQKDKCDKPKYPNQLKTTKAKELCQSEISVEDKRLITWNKWSEIRNKECNHLAKKTSRQPVDLVMNLVENVREDRERKMAIEHAQVEKKASIRDGTLWEQPLRLEQNCPCKPVYEIQRTAVEKGRPRKIEHVGVPKIVLTNEKGLTGLTERPVCENLNHEYNQYRRRREKELKNNIAKIFPFKPVFDNLAVKGSKPSSSEKSIPEVPIITICCDPEPVRDDLSGVYAIKINEAIFFKEQVGQHLKHLRRMRALNKVNCKKWTYYFNVPIKVIGTCKLILENLGTVSLRYCWKKIEHTISFIPERSHEHMFFFNKNEDVISPGQKKNIIFSCYCDKPGLYSELWELNFCNMNFFEGLCEKFTVKLNADINEDMITIKKNVRTLKHSIMEEVKFNIVWDILNDIITKSTVIVPQFYPYKNFLLEADMFVMKNRMCFYRQTEVAKLRSYYNEMHPNEEWDLSLGTWRKVMITKDFEARMSLYGKLKNSFAQLLKPWTEGDELSNRKYRAVFELLVQLANKFDDTFNDVTAKIKMKVKTDNIDVSPTPLDVLLSQTIHVVFQMRMRDHINFTIESCAGILSSLDLSREIDFDFCRQ